MCALFELDARVDVLCVLADDDEVEVVTQVACAFVSANRTHERVQVELLAQRDVDAAEATSDGRCDRPLERDVVLADRLEHMRGQWRAELLDGALARLLHIPLEPDAGGFEHAHGRIANFGPNPIPRDERYRVTSHAP